MPCRSGSRLHTPLRWRRLAVAAACVLASGWPVFASATDERPLHEVQAPHYGDTLFHFFQSQYFTSITTLMVSQHFERVAPHADEAEVLRGGMLLTYGLHREAGEIFARLIEKGAPPAVRDRAWFYLAKIRYQRGYLAPAEEALARVEQALPPELEEERGLLQANLLMARSDYSGAAKALSAMSAKAPDALYVRFNLGIAQIKSGDKASGTALLDELGQAYAENEEFRALRDRANLALGFAALADKQPQAARTYLARVRLKSLEANKALLGFGWAADALNDPQLALAPWLELSGREVSDSAALEARIAVPYAYAELGAYAQSLTHYQNAIADFERERSSLDASIEAIRSGQLVDALLASNPGDDMGEAWRMDVLPELPHAAHLTALLAQHEFQEAFKNLRDLRYLTANLQAWRDKIDTFNDMLETRRKAFAERLPQVRARASEAGIENLRQRLDAAQAQVTQGEADQDGVAFADGKQHELLARIARVKAMTAQPDAAPDIAQARDRVRLAAGTLTWQLAQTYPERVWEAKKNLQVIREGLAEAQRRDAALAQAQRDEPARFDLFDQRIKALSPVIDAMLPRVAALSKEQQGLMQDIAVAELTRQKARLDAYAMQARFAVAQLYDRANKGADDASKP